MLHGLAENAEDFPESPVSVEVLHEALLRFNAAKDAAASADGAAAEAHDVKRDAVADLSDKMKHVLRYAEIAVRNDEAKLKNIGWSGPREPAKAAPPGAPRSLEVKSQGRGWVYLDWKGPNEGGSVSAYRVLSRTSSETEWKELVLCFESMTVLTDQPKGVDVEYHVIAMNKAGEGPASNLITVVL
jgi:hypothetical protein